jgi:hypothetical protein
MNDPAGVQDVKHERGLHWRQLADLEPRLYSLLWRARQEGVACESWPQARAVVVRLASELTSLVGFQGEHHRHPILGSVAAYEVAYWMLVEAVTSRLEHPAPETMPHPLSILSSAQPGGQPCASGDTAAGEARIPSLPISLPQGWALR